MDAALANLMTDAKTAPPLLREAESTRKALTPLNSHLLQCQLHCLDVIDEFGKQDNDRERYRYANGEVPEATRALMRELYGFVELLQTPLKRLSDELETIIGDDDRYGFGQAEAEGWYGICGSLANRLDDMNTLARAMAAVDDKQTAPRARWLTKFAAAGRDEVRIAVSAVSAADALNENLWQRGSAIVLTSATLAALGRFDRLNTKLGLPPQTCFTQLPSPFDYYNNATLHIPSDFCDASRRNDHSDAMVKHLPRLTAEARAILVLFSARSQLDDVYERIDSDTRSNILKQDDYAKHVLINKHREAIDAGQRSIIFGLASLAEGLDLPGDYCQQVVIAKLPFAVPNDPVAETEEEWFKQAGKMYFMEVSVPEAALKLVQAAGRLLRKETDTGRITLLDNRVLSKGYGKAILESLPPYRQDFSPLGG